MRPPQLGLSSAFIANSFFVSARIFLDLVVLVVEVFNEYVHPKPVGSRPGARLLDRFHQSFASIHTPDQSGMVARCGRGGSGGGGTAAQELNSQVVFEHFGMKGLGQLRMELLDHRAFCELRRLGAPV
jgi:hypothetical protein